MTFGVDSLISLAYNSVVDVEFACKEGNWMANKEYTVGLDLGTTNSVISWVKPDGNVEVIPNAENRTTPSIVSFKTGEIVGEPR